MPKLKKKLQRLLNYFGFHLSGTHAKDVRWLKTLDIRTVIDIGASKGKASEELHKLFSDATIYAFEPLLDCFQQMQNRMGSVKNFHAFNCALGDMPGEVQMHRSSYSGSSSLRPMNDLHKTLWPITAGQREVRVSVDTLDNALGSYALEKNILVKIDTQGYEDRVIRGGKETLRQARIVVVETSFRELYEGQPLFDDTYALLKSLGFVYGGSWAPELKSPIDGSLLQQDAIFLRV